MGEVTRPTSAEPVVFPKIDRHPPAYNWNAGKLSEVPTYSPYSEDPFQVDLCSADLSALDLRSSLTDLFYADFNSKTIWPSKDLMPPGFDWNWIMELGKNPGLGIRELTAQGITGRGVGIAILDQTLLVEHIEYADRIQLYEEINYYTNAPSAMHGPAVTSIAVGRTVGVAPEANVYYIAANVSDPSSTFSDPKRNFHFLAQGVHRILEINRQLPEGQKIRVISMSIGWKPDEIGYDEITTAVSEAKAAGMLVVSGNMEQAHGYKLFGLGRLPFADPDRFDSYRLGVMWAMISPDDPHLTGSLMITMDSRTTASFTGTNDYVFFGIGGGSWTMPYLAGVYALAAQVDPTITPERFLALAMKTGHIIEFKQGGKSYLLGPIIDPVSLIEALKIK